jgi:hypothetical protein
MAKKAFVHRKQRTREHVIADLSVHHVEGFILAEGHTAQVIERDYGYDLLMFTFDERGYAEPGMVLLQLKAAETLQQVGADYVFDLDIRDFNLWTLEVAPVILVLFDASQSSAFWLDIHGYFRVSAHRPKKGAKTVRVRIPVHQRVDRAAVARMRNLNLDRFRK